MARGKKKSSDVAQKLKQLYYKIGKAGSYGGARRLLTAINEEQKAKKKTKTITAAAVRKWLQSQDVYTLHKPVVRRFKRRRTVTSGVGEQLQIDLADVSAVKDENNGFKWLLFCIDIFSKKAWVAPLKSKSATAVLDGFKAILAESGLKPMYVQSDKGTEFTNLLFQNFLKREKIFFFTMENVETKASVV